MWSRTCQSVRLLEFDLRLLLTEYHQALVVGFSEPGSGFVHDGSRHLELASGLLDCSEAEILRRCGHDIVS